MSDRKLKLVQAVKENYSLLTDAEAQEIVNDYVNESYVTDLVTYAANHEASLMPHKIVQDQLNQIAV